MEENPDQSWIFGTELSKYKPSSAATSSSYQYISAGPRISRTPAFSSNDCCVKKVDGNGPGNVNTPKYDHDGNAMLHPPEG